MLTTCATLCSLPGMIKELMEWNDCAVLWSWIYFFFSFPDQEKKKKTFFLFFFYLFFIFCFLTVCNSTMELQRKGTRQWRRKMVQLLLRCTEHYKIRIVWYQDVCFLTSKTLLVYKWRGKSWNFSLYLGWPKSWWILLMWH